MNNRVCLERDPVVDPGGPWIDDRHAGEHVRLVDPVAELGRGDRKLRAGVDAERRELVGAAPRRGPPTVGDKVGDRVGEVKLALGVARIELLERRPERAGGEDVGGGVELPDLALLRRGVPVLDDRLDASVVAADDPAVRERPHRLEREDRHRGVLACVLGGEFPQVRGGQQRRRRIEHEQVAFKAGERVAGRGDGIAGAERLLLNRDLHSLVGVRRVGRGDDHDRVGSGLAGRPDHPVDHAPAEQRVQVLRHGRPHPRPEPACHHYCREVVRGSHGVDDWAARIRTWDRGTKTRCLTAWLRPITE